MKRILTVSTIAAVAGLACAASLDTNLVVNGGFDSVDTNTTGPFTSVLTLNWIDADGDGDDPFAYPYSSLYSGANVPPDAGDYHYAGGFNTDLDDPTQPQLFQIIDVSGGATATLIASGGAFYDLRAYFSSYRGQGEATTVTALFLSSGGATLGQASIGGEDFVASLPVVGGQVEWGEDRSGGEIPVGTASIVIGLFADGASENHDGYVDNVDVRVSSTRPPVPPSGFSIGAPSDGSFFAELPATIDWSDSNAADDYDLVLTDRNGQTALAVTVTASEFELAAGSLPDGVYDISIEANNQFGSTAAGNAVNFGVITGNGGGAPGCNVADVAEPFGILDLSDISGFIGAFTGGCP